MTSLRKNDLSTLPPAVRFAFSPLVKRAFGWAVGGTLGLSVFLVTLTTYWFAGAEQDYVGLLCQYFYGYDVSYLGAGIGLLWGFWTGFVMGWFVAAFRNFLIALWIFVIRAKAQLSANRDFLDHI